MKTVFRVLGITLAVSAGLILTQVGGVPGFGSQPAQAQDENPMTLQELLNAVRQGRVRERRENEQRLQEFRSQRNRQAQLLQQAEADLAAEQQTAEELEAQSQANEEQIAVLQNELTEALGNAGELFGTVRQVAADTQAQLKQSLVSAQYPNRGDALDPLTRGRVLPTLDQLVTLWATLHGEMTAQGQIVSFSSEYFTPEGVTQGDVVRIGPFTAMVEANGDFLSYEDETDALNLLGKQPAGRFRDAADRLVGGSPNTLTEGAVDPSQGAILSLLVRTPSLIDRVDQGRTIGYIIIVLGSLGILLAIYRFLSLSITALRVRGQMRSPDKPGKGNPLGRILMVYDEMKDKHDEETIELKLDEAFLKEQPRLQWGLATVRVMAAIAPLLGLLGTVTGMIVVFQQITLFGTGDPKLMAGGISQALVTTVLGLTFAIPLLLLHSIAAGRAKEVEQILEEQSAGLVAKRAEGRH